MWLTLGMARPVWSGTISFGLVAIPVKLFHAVRRQSVSFNQLDERNMARIRYRKVNAETGEEVSDDHIVKGYEISKGRYVVVDPDELEPFMPAATKSVDLEEFVDLVDIDPVYFDTAYHLAPDGHPSPTSCSHGRWRPAARWRSAGSSCATSSTRRRYAPKRAGW